MRNSSYCTANEYNIQKLTNFLIDEGLEPRIFDHVIHVNKEIEHKNKKIDIFYFPFGSVIFWNTDEEEEKLYLENLKPFEKESYAESACDIIHYNLDKNADKAYINEELNEIILDSDDDFIKLSISHALAQSVKLEILELSVNRILESTNTLHKELAERGKVKMSRKNLAKKIGMLFKERYYVNMHSDVLDTPEFFWRRPSYEPIYLSTTDFMDIETRQNILYRRLEMIHELYSILSEELHNRHSSRLEWIIIMLIAIEVVVGFMHSDIIMNFISNLF